MMVDVEGVLYGQDVGRVRHDHLRQVQCELGVRAGHRKLALAVAITIDVAAAV
jgi:hypothetical protein